jgi:hypothetical protein
MARTALPIALLAAFDTPAVAAPATLLSELLEEAPLLSAALSNVAQELGAVDASFALKVERDLNAMSAALEGWTSGREGAAAALAVQATDVQDDVLARLGGLAIDLGPVATTAVGSLQAADLTGSFNAGVLTDRVAFVADAASLTVTARGGVAALVALQNVSANAGEVAAEVDLRLADAAAGVDGIATTAIGALQNGALQSSADLAATVQGQMGEISATTAAVVMALVGS